MPDDPQHQSTDWDRIWIMLQELGAALHPVLEGDDPPEWATDLSAAMDAAQDALPDHLPEEADA